MKIFYVIRAVDSGARYYAHRIPQIITNDPDDAKHFESDADAADYMNAFGFNRGPYRYWEIVKIFDLW